MSRDIQIYVRSPEFPGSEFNSLLSVFRADNCYKGPFENFPYFVDEWVMTSDESLVRVRLLKSHERLAWPDQFDWLIALGLGGGSVSHWHGIVFSLQAFDVLPVDISIADLGGEAMFSGAEEYTVWANKYFEEHKDRKLRKMGLVDDDWHLVNDPFLLKYM